MRWADGAQASFPNVGRDETTRARTTHPAQDDVQRSMRRNTHNQKTHARVNRLAMNTNAPMLECANSPTPSTATSIANAHVEIANVQKPRRVLSGFAIRCQLALRA